MKRKLSWMCAVAVGMSLLPGAYGAPEATNDPNATAASTAPVVAPATEGVMTATPARTEALTPATRLSRAPSLRLRRKARCSAR
nr:hypothetical protein [Cronobacter sakazakii]